MPYTIATARDVVRESVVHAGGDTFLDSKVDRATVAACNRFLRETQHHVVRSTLSTTSGQADLSLAGLTGFRPELIVRVPFVEQDGIRYGLERISEQTLADYLECRGAASGRPECVSFPAVGIMTLYPTPDDAYTVRLDHAQVITTYQDSTPIPIGDEWVYDVLWYGARAYMLLGAAGHGDAGPAMQEFMRMIQQARGEMNPGGVLYTGAA